MTLSQSVSQSTPESFSWASWELDHPEILLLILVAQVGYLLLVGPMRGLFVTADLVKPKTSQIVLFTLGILVLFIADTGPIHRLSEDYLFSAHMLQHVLMTLVAPPLLLLGTPAWLVRPLIQTSTMGYVARFVTSPIFAFSLFNAVFALWHLPPLYEEANRRLVIHIVQHLSMISTAMLMWWPLASPLPELPRSSPPFRILYIFLLPVAQIIVFGPIVFSNKILYPFYAEAPRLWGLTPLADQQIGGALMKIVSTAIFLIAISVIFFRWFASEEAQERKERVPRYGEEYSEE